MKLFQNLQLVFKRYYMNDNILILSTLANKVSEWHSNLPLKESNSFRGHDKKTPYYVHPVGCAYFIMEDNNNISYEKRFEIAIVMLCHDLLEDTDLTEEDLRTELSLLLNNTELVDVCINNIKKCTLEKGLGSLDEFKILKEKEKEILEEIWYIKLVDKFYNVWGSKDYFIKKGTLGKYLEFLEFLIQKTEETTNFKDSMFISQAKAIVNTLKKI